MTLSLPKILPAENNVQEIRPEELEVIGRLLFERHGFQLGSYKSKCVTRRINIRIRATNAGTSEAYCDLLGHDDRELQRLFKTLTIHVSHFFRNPSVFVYLRDKVLPQMFSEGRSEELLFWSVGCSSGEESYSLAILLKEYFGGESSEVPARIIGTDINPDILDVAREGLYQNERVAEIPPELLERYFVTEFGKFRLNREIREMLTFQQEDILSPEIKRRSDMILCRNVMIYFERPSQEEMLMGFADSLSGGGFLVLGKSETIIGEARRHFQLINPVERIYRCITRDS